MATDPSVIYVQSTQKQLPDKGFPVALSEQDDRHPSPDGWVYIADDRVHHVYRTPGVADRIARGLLIEVVDPMPAQIAPPAGTIDTGAEESMSAAEETVVAETEPAAQQRKTRGR